MSAAPPSSSFVPNNKLPIHRWFRYSAGFSGAWAERIIAARLTPEAVVLDPFAGVGTTLIAAQLAGRRSVGVEAHPFVARLAKAKLQWTTNVSAFERAGARALVLARGKRRSPAPRTEPSLLASAFSPPALDDLRRLRRAIEETTEEGSSERQLSWFALVSILRACSSAGTAPWQYVLPKKQKARVASPYERFESQLALIASDMHEAASGHPTVPAALLHRGDARSCEEVETASVDLVLTSPPYPNNYDYADATRLEQTFLGEVAGWGGLQEASRRFLVRACSQHSAAEHLRLDEVLADEALHPIRKPLTEVCQQLCAVRETRGGKKTYHTMIAAYFADMARVWRALARVVRPGGHALFVIGDSAPYGVYVPVDEWLRVLAEAAGFAFVGFREVRKRNVKWKNRKHRVPLKEGELTMVRRDG